ncbi:NAD-dependent deacetylase sirtuin-2 [Metarhizium rileyi]|uniref:NAD-dependent protein deacetylase n=1 Tax=Metarhizium rileyi (strain RCEF 4871) TaxID=1649241 RepID=A0A166Y9F4_METRR|nr:NAD-dependent deacetylase sirtuin-2 [Metarhizium rileyi RCEF 4871]
MGQEESTLVDESVPPETLTERSLSAVADYIKTGRTKRIVVLTGAGISTAAGIPDFRSPKTGLYNNLARLNLPYAEAVFDIAYFRQHPEPFYVLAQELYPGKFHPTVSHAFIALLAQKGLLQMLFTQNIDCLERRAGVPAEKIIEAHGSFATQRCIECKIEFPDHLMRDHVFRGQVPRCKEDGCTGTVKPDIVFFGEALPSAFGEKSHQTAMADLVLILGTSLTVYPFAGLPDMARHGKPRVLFNMERVGQLGGRADDVMELGPCDEGVRKLADELGWRDELEDYWRELVGHEEAERQMRSAKEGGHEVEDEVQKLAAGVEEALRFDDSEDEAGAPKERDVETAHKAGEDEKHETVASGELTVGKKEGPTDKAESSKQDPGTNAAETITRETRELASAEHDIDNEEKNREVEKRSL